MLNLITTGGFRESVCDNIFYSAPITKFWSFTFVLSKVPELGEAPSLIIFPVTPDHKMKAGPEVENTQLIPHHSPLFAPDYLPVSLATTGATCRYVMFVPCD